MNIYERSFNKLLEDIENGKRVSPMKAIRAHCWMCMGFSAKEVKDCRGDTGEPNCPLFKFRFGRNMTGRTKH